LLPAGSSSVQLQHGILQALVSSYDFQSPVPRVSGLDPVCIENISNKILLIQTHLSYSDELTIKYTDSKIK
jgi:hypothetical protein